MILQWSTVVLAAALAGPVLGAVALAIHGVLVVGVDHGLSPETVASLQHLRLAVQAIGALPIGLYALAVSFAGGLPRVLACAGVVVGSATMLAATSVFVATSTARAVTLAALAAATVWMLAVSVWLLLHSWEPARFDTPWVTTRPHPRRHRGSRGGRVGRRARDVPRLDRGLLLVAPRARRAGSRA